MCPHEARIISTTNKVSQTPKQLREGIVNKSIAVARRQVAFAEYVNCYLPHSNPAPAHSVSLTPRFQRLRWLLVVVIRICQPRPRGCPRRARGGCSWCAESEILPRCSGSQPTEQNDTYRRVNTGLLDITCSIEPFLSLKYIVFSCSVSYSGSDSDSGSALVFTSSFYSIDAPAWTPVTIRGLS